MIYFSLVGLFLQFVILFKLNFPFLLTLFVFVCIIMAISDYRREHHAHTRMVDGK